MTIKELRKLLEAVSPAIDDCTQVCINDSRDGNPSYPLAEAKFVKTRENDIILTFGYK